MKNLLIIILLLYTPIYGNASELNLEIDDARSFTADKSMDVFLDEDDEESTFEDSTPLTAKQITHGVAGGIIGGLVGAIVISNIAVASADCENDTEQDLCRGLTAYYGALVGLPVGVALGASIAISYSQVDKTTLVTTGFRF